jgi:hypothetical protein
MHQAQGYLDASILLGAPPNRALATALNAGQASGLLQRLRQDGLGYAYSGALSIGEAASGIESRMFTWSTVKLYYAVFYLSRALLACRGVCIFYRGKTPYSIEAVAGKSPKKLSGTTHGVVLEEFDARRLFPTLVSQQIAGVKPLDWLRERREEANYSTPRFLEPSAPRHLEQIVRSGMRHSLDAYVADELKLYAFDEDHAMVAYPTELLKHILAELKVLGTGVDLSHDDRSFLASLYRDLRGPMACMHQLLVPR